MAWIMKTKVFFLRHYRKIFNSIIVFNPIAVMNNLCFFEFSSEMFFHYKTMFQKLIITNIYDFISLDVEVSAFPVPSAFSGIIFSSTLIGTASPIVFKSFFWGCPKDIIAVCAIIVTPCCLGAFFPASECSPISIYSVENRFANRTDTRKCQSCPVFFRKNNYLSYIHTGSISLACV